MPTTPAATGGPDVDLLLGIAMAAIVLVMIAVLVWDRIIDPALRARAVRRRDKRDLASQARLRERLERERREAGEG